jgi:hypothetical protein
MVFNGGVTNYGWDIQVRLNSDSGSNYSRTNTYGDGSSTASSRASNQTKMSNAIGFLANNTLNTIAMFNFMNYSNTNTFKTCLIRSGEATQGGTNIAVNLWRSTSAISSIYVYCGASNDGQANLYAGTTITLYGIKAA